MFVRWPLAHRPMHEVRIRKSWNSTIYYSETWNSTIRKSWNSTIGSGDLGIRPELILTISAPSRGNHLSIYNLQRGVQWKQGVVMYMMLHTSLLYNTSPIHCTLLPLHPPLMNTQSSTTCLTHVFFNKVANHAAKWHSGTVWYDTTWYGTALNDLHTLGHTNNYMHDRHTIQHIWALWEGQVVVFPFL